MAAAQESPESDEERRSRWQAEMEKQKKWYPVHEAIFQDPHRRHICPFCGKSAVRAAWGLYIKEPRAASFAAWCESCGEKYHCATPVPAHAPDSFPLGSSYPVGELSKRILDRGNQ